MKRRLTLRLVLYFSVALLVFALIIGSVFSVFFRRYTFDLHTNDLRTHAEAIAASLSGRKAADAPAPENAAVPPPRSEHSQRHRRMGRRREEALEHEMPQSAAPVMEPHTYCRRRIAMTPTLAAAETGGEQGLASLLRQLNAFTGSDIWLVDRPSQTITLSGTHTETDYTELPPAAETLLETVFAGKDTGKMLSAGRRKGTDVYGDVEDGAADDPDQLCLGVGLLLEMEPADDAVYRAAFVVLDEIHGTYSRLEVAVIERLEKVSPGVLEDLRLDYIKPFKRSIPDFHHSPSPFSIRLMQSLRESCQWGRASAKSVLTFVLSRTE